ncbi:hypothetical protein DMN91_012757 [Ooceraea biroi]|uniref:Dehydrogenase/reductase SDR family member n=1 Tax=Ooceraea biroi TaxID=2015173 RepID=A0A3L8D3A4_OOCBI|nr:hypothetical protein DMN91_012757 [Ooceraea biroi]
MKVIAVARRLEKLQELAANIKDEYKTDIYPMQCDVQKEEDILKVFEWAHEKLGEGKTANYHHIMNVNVIAAAICSRELVQSAKRRKTPAHIVNISSMAGHCPELITYPISVYAASKSALNSMAATLRNELINSKLDVKVTEGKVALVTGASVGIGAAIARELAKNGMKVIAVARRLEKLQELVANIKGEYKADIYPMQCDVQKEEDILKVFEWAHKKLGGVDVLFNNAGVVYPEPIIEGKTANYHHIMNVNVIAATICSRELVQSSKRRKTPAHIINISSITGHHAELINLPMSVYPASKYALTGMAATLRNELTSSNLDVKVTVINP